MGKKSIENIINSTDILDLKVDIGNKSYTIDMREELKISESTVTSALKKQPTHYAFLATIHRRALVIKREKEGKLNKIYSTLFAKYKSDYNPVKYPRGISNDLVNAKVERNLKYIKAKKELESITAQVDVLEVYVRAFEQRSSLIQTLSANMRKETFN